ncbi:MAG: hypothetical protein WCT46_02070 [Candidatus Gracilibacteria bacterium]|jgi:hypothetical protein
MKLAETGEKTGVEQEGLTPGILPASEGTVRIATSGEMLQLGLALATVYRRAKAVLGKEGGKYKDDEFAVTVVIPPNFSPDLELENVRFRVTDFFCAEGIPLTSRVTSSSGGVTTVAAIINAMR